MNYRIFQINHLMRLYNCIGKKLINEIAFIKEPLDKYTSIQQKISEQIKSIGGSGYMHGAIIDIDYYNHIYVNPHDLTITGYFAYDVINKQFYKNIPALLKADVLNYLQIIKSL